MEHFERGRNITLLSSIIQLLAALPIIQHTVLQSFVEVVGGQAGISTTMEVAMYCHRGSMAEAVL